MPVGMDLYYLTLAVEMVFTKLDIKECKRIQNSAAKLILNYKELNSSTEVLKKTPLAARAISHTL